MIRAAAAKLANPNMSSYKALKVGGFDVPDRDSNNKMCGDGVVLKSRKTNMCRKVKMAMEAQTDVEDPRVTSNLS